MVTAATDLAAAREIAAAVPDPELPMVTVADLGILRDVAAEDGRLVVTITPTYSGCPALREIAHDLRYRLSRAGLRRGHRAHRARARLEQRLDHGRGPPEAAGGRHRPAPCSATPDGTSPTGPPHRGPVPLTLTARREPVACPRCGSRDTTQTAAFGATACKALFRCEACREPFEYVKEI